MYNRVNLCMQTFIKRKLGKNESYRLSSGAFFFFWEGEKGVSYIVGQTWNDSLDLAKPGCARV